MITRSDVAIVGAGPAGLATAISLALVGQRVALLDRAKFPRHRPGETLHPGVETILRKLGVEEEVALLAPIRHRGIWVTWYGRPSFVPYGEDGLGSWLGYQIRGATLDSILMNRAKQLGVQILQPCGHVTLLSKGERAVGIRYSGGEIMAPYVVDASGGAHWLERQLSRPLQHHSPRLFASYGYSEIANAAQFKEPRIEANKDGWVWVAQIDLNLCQWTQLNLDSKINRVPPKILSISDGKTKTYGCDVTWRSVQCAAGKGYFVAGDAAMVLDPASSHGVLRALMSGLMIGHLVPQALNGYLSESEAARLYNDWILKWLEQDTVSLRHFYRELEPCPSWIDLPIGDFSKF